jgi:hypothetical protein
MTVEYPQSLTILLLDRHERGEIVAPMSHGVVGQIDICTSSLFTCQRA